MVKYCEQFEGGYCNRVKMHVPKGWCLDVCKGNWDGKTINSADTISPIKIQQTKYYEQLSLKEMAANFAGAMKRAIVEGFKTVDKQEFIERQMCCTTCGKAGRCPYCGCLLSWKDKLKSERACPNPETYPNLKKYPPRNYWEVCGQKTTAIITARNEPGLNRTIKSLLDNATGDIEIIVVLDGCDYDVMPDKRIKVLKNPKSLGRRVSINNASRLASGKYLFHIDAHCTVEIGWDTKLKCACDENSIVISMLQPLADDWNYKGRCYSFVSLDQNLMAKWWGSYNSNPNKLIEETMAFTGCGWMIQKEYYLRLGGFDESLGEYGHCGAEWSLKVWLHPEYPGRVLLRKDVICGHKFGTNNNQQSYTPMVLPQNEFKPKMVEKYGGQINDLVDKFWPVPGWSKKDKIITIIKCIDDSPPESLLHFCSAFLVRALPNNQIVAVRKPINKPRCLLTLYEQMLEGVKVASNARYVFIAEQDCLYHPSRFDFVPPKDDVFYYEATMLVCTNRGFILHRGEKLSTLVCNRKLLIENLLERIRAIKKGWKVKYAEPGKADPQNKWQIAHYETIHPSLDIRHGNNYTGDRAADSYLSSVDYWGDCKEVRKKTGLVKVPAE